MHAAHQTDLLTIWELPQHLGKKTGQKREKQKEQDLDKEQDQKKKIKDSGQHTRGDSRSVAAFLLTLPLTNGSTSR